MQFVTHTADNRAPPDLACLFRYKSFLKIALEDQRVQNAIVNALIDAMEEEQAAREAEGGSPDASA